MLLVCLRRAARGLQLGDPQYCWGVKMFGMLVCVSVARRASRCVHLIVLLFVDGVALKGWCARRSGLLVYLSGCLSA